uniref:Uncharacterized protein n=1 Tax=Globisporangium ultimum (strain ATCC 200006 / CBS 805.95 / DAOM BR144) TaxID=431595 RepID=K3X4D6_GLOUD
MEFIEAIVPIAYSLYLSITFCLPNRAFYVNLRDIDTAELAEHVGYLMAYTLLEIGSLVVLGTLLQRRLRVSMLHYLAFVLATEWQQVHVKLIF